MVIVNKVNLMERCAAPVQSRSIFILFLEHNGIPPQIKTKNLHWPNPFTNLQRKKMNDVSPAMFHGKIIKSPGFSLFSSESQLLSTRW